MRTTPLISALATAGAASLIVSGCSTGSDTSTPESSSSSQSSAQFNDADVEYARGMLMHHEQAIEMSDIVLDKPGIDPQVTTLARQIKKAQGPEITQMESWLTDWDQDDSGDEGHGESMSEDGGGHDGMLSPQALEELKAADGDDAEELFLDQMIEHHEGAVAMAQQHRTEGQDSQALQLSTDVIRDQKAEITTMREMRTSL
ncbi:DUF305 domain-containing protein [Janibacter sp. GS2]|uniref:DUF305 domain-containing protein n=1 Tax=Janibacter sp. GS2 TaxID=3442646 RepID=UPI003EB6B6C9